MRQSVTFEDAHCVQHTVTRIHHEERLPSLKRTETKQPGSPRTWRHVESLKQDLRHALSVSLGVQKNFREQNGMLIDNGAQYLYPALG